MTDLPERTRELVRLGADLARQREGEEAVSGPTTEAGRRLLAHRKEDAGLHGLSGSILAIEAEAHAAGRAEALGVRAEVHAGGRAVALMELRERVGDVRRLLRIAREAQNTYVGRHWPSMEDMRRDGIGHGLVEDAAHERFIRRYLDTFQPEFMVDLLAALDAETNEAKWWAEQVPPVNRTPDPQWPSDTTETKGDGA